MSYIKNILKVPALFWILRSCQKRQRRFMADTLLPEIEDFKKTCDDSLTERDFNKITNYYGFAIPIIGEFYCVLRGRKITVSERTALMYLGGLTGLFDDFFDEKDTAEDHLKELISFPRVELAKNSHEKLFIQFYLKGLERGNSEDIKKYLNVINEAQMLSKRQTNPNLSKDEIAYITEQKGGVSFWYYRSPLHGEMSEVEKDLLFKIGFLAQLENDIFDVYKDREQGIYTLANTTTSIGLLRVQYLRVLDDIYNLIHQLDFEPKNKERFSRLIAMIAARGLVCLHQYEKLEGKNGFDVSKYSRKELICDMGKSSNTIKLIRFYLKYSYKGK